MTDLRKAAKEALWAFQYHVEQTWTTDRSTAAIAALRAALAQQEEPVTEDMKSAVRLAPSSAYWSQQLRGLFGPYAREGIDALERRLAEAQQAEPHPDYPCRSDGRCQYAIDHGAEGLGSCPKGKCAMAQPQPAEDRAVAQDNLRAALAQQDAPVWMHPWPPVRAQQAEPQTLDEAMQQSRAMAQAYENGYNAGVAHEREACAQVCEARFMGDLNREDMEARRCAAAIRARGEQP